MPGSRCRISLSANADGGESPSAAAMGSLRGRPPRLAERKNLARATAAVAGGVNITQRSQPWRLQRATRYSSGRHESRRASRHNCPGSWPAIAFDDFQVVLVLCVAIARVPSTPRRQPLAAITQRVRSAPLIADVETADGPSRAPILCDMLGRFSRARQQRRNASRECTVSGLRSFCPCERGDGSMRSDCRTENDFDALADR